MPTVLLAYVTAEAQVYIRLIVVGSIFGTTIGPVNTQIQLVLVMHCVYITSPSSPKDPGGPTATHLIIPTAT